MGWKKKEEKGEKKRIRPFPFPLTSYLRRKKRLNVPDSPRGQRHLHPREKGKKESATFYGSPPIKKKKKKNPRKSPGAGKA